MSARKADRIDIALTLIELQKLIEICHRLMPAFGVNINVALKSIVETGTICWNVDMAFENVPKQYAFEWEVLTHQLKRANLELSKTFGSVDALRPIL
jgi:hypothetical protein